MRFQYWVVFLVFFAFVCVNLYFVRNSLFPVNPLKKEAPIEHTTNNFESKDIANRISTVSEVVDVAAIKRTKRLEYIRGLKFNKSYSFVQPTPPPFHVYQPASRKNVSTHVGEVVSSAQIWIKNTEQFLYSRCAICVEHYKGSKELWEKYIEPQYYANLDPTSVAYRGVYLEMGALDGISGSNSLFFDEALQWDGLLIEPSPPNFAQLVVKRPHAIKLEIAACPCDDSRACELEFVSDGGGVGGSIEALKPRYNALKQKIQAGYKVACAPMSFLFDQAGITKIDFWSLDNEGAELITLRTVDWAKVSVWMILVEFNPVFGNLDQLSAELVKAGFVMELRMGTMNQLWVNPQYHKH